MNHTSPLDWLLQGRPPEFKNTVRALVQRYDIDEQDPTFILLTGTSTLEALLEQYPQEFERMFIYLLDRFDKKWTDLQQEWTAAATVNSNAASQFTQALSQIQTTAAAEQEKIRVQAGTQTELIMSVFQAQKKELEAQAAKLAAHAIAQAQTNAHAQIQEWNKGIKWKHYLEAVGIACACAAALMLTSWTTAWISRGRAENNTVWADIERWNAEALQNCRDEGAAICSFQIKEAVEEE